MRVSSVWRKNPAILLTALLAACISPSSPSSHSLSVYSSSSASLSEAAIVFSRSRAELRNPDRTQTITLDVEIAYEEAALQRGLMFRDHLESDSGMLFIFQDEQVRSFWMKNTLIPLDVIFFDAGGKFVSATTMQPCAADPCPGYPSGGEAKYALEVTEGYAKKNGIGVGWILQISD